eukprot:a513251_65.p1 GENE.a513251_65~~a513251_65.p1  ORF type:complete len:174 (-),score=40.08 a513251_65:104-571(-)
MSGDIVHVLVLCTGNSCRSQMAEAFLRKALPSFRVESAGTRPAGFIHPFALAAMSEVGIDLASSGFRSKSVDEFMDAQIDTVITVCDNANESCPRFSRCRAKLHVPFEDPAAATGTDDEVIAVFRRIRSEIESRMASLAQELCGDFPKEASAERH